MFEKHFIEKKKLNMVCILSEALQWGKNSWTAMEKYRNEAPTEWVKFTEGMKWKNVRVGFFLCVYHYIFAKNWLLEW